MPIRSYPYVNYKKLKIIFEYYYSNIYNIFYIYIYIYISSLRNNCFIHIKESLFKYLFIYMRSMFKKMARWIYKI